MARMFPSDINSETVTDSEMDVFYALREGLDDSYTVFHSYNILSRNFKGSLIDGEIDFLIFSPRYGILVLEVKGGSIRYEPEKDLWFQNNAPTKESPFNQAARNVRSVLEFLKKNFNGRAPVYVGKAVCFPDVNVAFYNLPAFAEGITLIGPQLRDINRAIVTLFENNLTGKRKKYSAAVTEKVLKVLIPNFEFIVSFADYVENVNRRIHRLTERQSLTLLRMHDHKRLYVQGCAGSGKTIIALKKVRELALAGKKVLLLCYNEPLGEMLNEATKKVSSNCTTMSYHRFCLFKLPQEWKPKGNYEDGEYWTEKVPNQFIKFLDENPIKYDAIIVDEAQDFKDEYWVTIQEMLRPDSLFYVFYDPDQNIYNLGPDPSVPIEAEPITLFENCRNTKTIYRYIEPFARTRMLVFPQMPEGMPVVEEVCPDRNAQRKKLESILSTLIKEKGLSEDKIIVLGGHRMENTSIGDDPHIGNFTLSENGVERGKNIVSYMTYMRFKGCESDAVICIDVDTERDDRWATRERLYCAMSRARILLYVLYRNEAKAEPVLAI